jgi:hypothetical protein
MSVRVCPFGYFLATGFGGAPLPAAPEPVPMLLEVNLALGGGVIGIFVVVVIGLSLTGWGAGCGRDLLLTIGGRLGSVLARGAGTGLESGRRFPAALVFSVRVTSLLLLFAAPWAVAYNGSPVSFSFSFFFALAWTFIAAAAAAVVLMATLLGKSVRGAGLRDFSRSWLFKAFFSPRRGFRVVETQSLVRLKWRKAINVSTAHNIMTLFYRLVSLMFGLKEWTYE